MSDFLPQLRRLHSIALQQPSHKSLADVFFLLKPVQGGVFVSVVNKDLEPMEADWRAFDGNTAQVLRTLENIREEEAFHISWGEETENGEVALADWPHLVYQLVRCQNLVAQDGQPITVGQEETTLRIVLEGEQKIDIGLCTAAAPEEQHHEVAMLSDSFALLGHTIWPVTTVGENFRQLGAFLQPFAEDMLEQWLSVFYSYVTNVQVVYADYKVKFSEKPLLSLPALLFEKIDSDKTLYLRLTQTAEGLPLDFMQQFDLSAVATLTDDHRISVRRLERPSLEDDIEALYKEIKQYAPNKSAQHFVYQEGDEFIVPEETAGPFLLSALPSLVTRFHLIGAEKLREYKVKAVKPKLNINLSSGIDFLEGDARLMLGDEEFTLHDILAQYGKKRYVTLSDGNRALLDDGYMRRLERIFNKKDKNGKVKVSFFDLPEIEDLIDEPLDGEAFKHHREVYEGFNKLAEQKLKLPKVKAKLRPYQQEGVKWLKYLYDNRLGGCLADDMGLGKTLQTIGLLSLVYPKEKRPTLLVMPRSLLFNWQSELNRFAPTLTHYTYYGTTRNIDEAMTHHIVLTTYAIVRNDIDTFRQQQFHCIILDESQNIKNMATQTTQAALLLQGEHRFALSGTPIENHLAELYSLFRFLNPTMFGTLDDFNARYGAPIQHDGDKDAMLALRRRIFPFMLRRLKKDVLKDLPDRIEQTLYVEMEPDQQRFYEQRRRYYQEQVNAVIAKDGIKKSQFVMFQALGELRRIASVPESLSDGHIHSPKLDLLADQLMEAVANGHKVVVFFNFIAGIELLSDRLDAAGIDYACMTGSTHDRKSVVERFQNDADCMVMLMTLKTGGVGLNLTAADTVFIFEPWWNKAAEEQAINRLHRFGQKAKVLSYALITQGTIEEKIRLLQEQKAELFDGLISADSSSSKQLTEEDINFILG